MTPRIVAAAISVVFERTMFRRLYRSSDLDQCLLTIGLVFVSVATMAYVWGTIQQPVSLPSGDPDDAVPQHEMPEDGMPEPPPPDDDTAYGADWRPDDDNDNF